MTEARRTYLEGWCRAIAGMIEDTPKIAMFADRMARYRADLERVEKELDHADATA